MDAEVIATNIKDASSHEEIDLWQDLAERAGVVKEYRMNAVRKTFNIRLTTYNGELLKLLG